MDVEAASTETAIRTLVQRLLQREPTVDEVTGLRQLYVDMAEVGDPELARAWAAASCFALASSAEALFY